VRWSIRSLSSRVDVSGVRSVRDGVLRSALGLTQGWSVDANRLALVSQAAKQGLGQVFIAEQARPMAFSIEFDWSGGFGSEFRPCKPNPSWQKWLLKSSAHLSDVQMGTTVSVWCWPSGRIQS
jgi:hypothetical protein